MLAHRLIFVRHGETDWNAERRLQGQRDIPLNMRGRHQAREAGRKVRHLLGPETIRTSPPSCIASPLGRATETMDLVRAEMGLDAGGFATDARLLELTFGEWEGLTWPEVQARSPQAASWREGDKWNFVPPGGESYAMLEKRLEPWLREVDSERLVVSHGGVARVLMSVLGGLATERAALADIWQGRVLVFHKNRFDWL